MHELKRLSFLFSWRFACGVIATTMIALNSPAEIPPDFRIEEGVNGKVTLSWSDEDSEWIEWYPQTSGSLQAPWQAIAESRGQGGGRFSLELTATGSLRFFRLCRSPVFFVDASNSNAGDGSLANPFRTINLGLSAAKQSFIANGKRPVVYVFAGDYTESLAIDSTGVTDYRLTLMDSSNRLVIDGTTLGDFTQTARIRPPDGTTPISVDGLAAFALLGFDVKSQGAHCIDLRKIGDAYLYFNELEPNGGDGYHIRNSNIFMNFPSVGVFQGGGDEGVEIINDDGLGRRVIIQNGSFGFGLSAGNSDGTLRHGISISASSGELNAELAANFIVSLRETVITTDGGLPSSLVLDLLSNSTLSTTSPGVLTHSVTGSGTHSTIIRAWQSPYQVTSTLVRGDEPGGIRFEGVTFDTDGDPSNGFSQVHFNDTLMIGAAPPFTVIRVVGPGLAFVNCAGGLRIDTLQIANRNAPGLVNTGGSLLLDIGTSTIDTQ